MSIRTLTRSLPAQRTGIKTIFANLLKFEALWRQRQKLSQLDDAALRDMGISRADAQREARRVAWDVPSHWRR